MSGEQITSSDIDDSSESMMDALMEVFRVALPLMISAGTFSLVLFADRTLLLYYDGPSMSASMAGGALFWVVSCLPVGIVSMTGAIVGQHIGAGEQDRIGRLMWQAVWLAIAFIPWFAFIAFNAESLFRATGQPESLIGLESTYLSILMIGAVGLVVESALSGFFSGTEKTAVIMWISVASGVLNLFLDLLLIFGYGPIPALGITGAAIASVISFWFKAVVFATLLLWFQRESLYKLRGGFGFDRRVFGNLLFFGFPTGLMYLIESGGFTVILLRIGNLGDVPLRATTMAINFNMIAFIPLMGVSIAASVLVGKHLLGSGPSRAAKSAYAALGIGLIYSFTWLVAYLAIPDVMLSLYEATQTTPETREAIALARDLLKFVAIYVVLDAAQIIFAGSLRGAGDTWFVMVGGFAASVLPLIVGFTWEPTGDFLHWWWYMIIFWIWLLAAMLAARFVQGGWKKMRMV
jgi:MATE family multidrug resistance protein